MIIGNVDELWSSSCLQERNNADTTIYETQHQHLVSSPGLVATCSLQLATSPNSVTTCDTPTPHPPSPAAIAHDGISLMCDTGSPHLVMSQRAVMVQKKMPMNAAKLNALVGEHLMRSFTYTSDRDNNASDTSSEIRPPYLKPKNRGDRSSSPASKCSRLDVTRAGSECSNGDGDGDGLGTLCEQDLRLMAEVLAADCSLLEAENELGLQVLNADCAKMDKVHSRQASHSNSMDRDDESQFCGLNSSFYHGIYKDQAIGTPPCSHENMKDTFFRENGFAREHLRRLCDVPCERTTSGLQEDPTFALQGRLQDLLLVARVSDLVQDQEKDVHASSHFGSGNAGDHSDGYEDGVMGMLGSNFMKSLSEDKRRDSKATALRKELSLMSSELAEVKKALASQKRDTQFCSRGQTQQTVAEDMYCKETIRRLVQQMQAEIEQWSQLQDILCKLQEELDGLSETQRFWQEQAHRAEAQLLSLQEELHAWRYQAQSAQEELVMLRCERQILKNRVEMMEDAQMCMSGVNERVEGEPRCASVGTRHEEFGACESFVHSRNESGRSSVDLGTSSQRSFRKSIKKSMSFANNKENINTNKFQFGNLGVSTRAEPTGLQLSSKKADLGSKGKPMNPRPLAHFVNVNFAKVDSSEHLKVQERKKARLFAFKDKLTSASNVSKFSFNSESVKGEVLVGHANRARQDYTDTLWTLKPKASLACAPTSTPLPSAPTSTPSRVIFGNVVNISKH